MRKQFLLSVATACVILLGGTPTVMAQSNTTQQSENAMVISGRVLDENGDPAIGASVIVKGQPTNGTSTDANGRFTLKVKPGSILVITYVGYKTAEAKASKNLTMSLTPSEANLSEVVVTAMGVKKEKKSLGYAIDDINSEELMKNKTANPISSLSGKIAGVNITQSSGAAGAGAQIILRGGTSASETRDNQPLFVVDGIIYDNSSSAGGNSSFDGSTNASTTTTNRVMDINPEDIESMSVLKGPAAAALYGSRAANGVVLITTKRGKSGHVEVNLSAKYINSWVTNLPKAQNTFRRGFLEPQYDVNNGNAYTGVSYNDFSYNTWGDKFADRAQTYDNIGGFFNHGNIVDTNVSVAGGSETGTFYLSGSYFDQDGVVPSTGYTKSTFRFNGEQKWTIFTFGANAAYSESRTDKTLTSGGLWGSGGQGALNRLYTFGTTDDMTHYMNEDGSRYKLFGDRIANAKDEMDNPYWIINKNKIHDKTTRFTGSFNIKADLTSWWWMQFRMGVDNYTTTYEKTLAAGGVYKEDWQKGMISENTSRYNYVTTNFMTNFNKNFGDFDFNLLAGTSTDNTSLKNTGLMAYNFIVPDFYSFNNVSESNKQSRYQKSTKRLVGVYGELRADWKSTLFLTLSGRNDWTSTLPRNNRSYFYPAVSGAIVFTQFLHDRGILDPTSVLTFGKIRASWAKVGKDTGAYETATSVWPVGSFIGGNIGVGNHWQQGNNLLKPEMTKSTELGLELRFFNGRLKFDYAYYTNDSYNQIVAPRFSQASGYILRSINMGNVLNKGMELTLSGTAIATRDWEWETGINMAGNRGKLTGLPEGFDLLYVTDVQYGLAQAASIPDGNFMAIAGPTWTRVKEGEHAGKVILDKNGMPTYGSTKVDVGNREPKLTGGWNNTLRWKNLTFSMLWEFRIGGDVFNGTRYVMDQAGTSQFSAAFRQEPLVITGVQADGNGYKDVTYTFEPDKVYTFNGTQDLGYNIIKNYYTNYYNRETSNYITKVNSLRMRSISLSYDVPRGFLAKTKAIKRAVITASATNLLLFTNYDGDPEAAASGAGVGGSSSVGFDYCGVPSTASFAFGINLTF